MSVQLTQQAKAILGASDVVMITEYERLVERMGRMWAMMWNHGHRRHSELAPRGLA